MTVSEEIVIIRKRIPEQIKYIANLVNICLESHGWAKTQGLSWNPLFNYERNEEVTESAKGVLRNLQSRLKELQDDSTPIH